MSIADERRYLAQKLWRFGLVGWSYPHWRLTKKEEAIIAYWDKNGHIEHDHHMIRLTDAGRQALQDGLGKNVTMPSQSADSEELAEVNIREIDAGIEADKVSVEISTVLDGDRPR
jgi:DNA-binding PadR family transcriptional regulator